MPTYEYKCTSCGNLFEYFQKITDSPIVKCENCGGELKRLISGGAGPIFKGTGFYQTDYKNSRTGKSEKSGNETKEKKETQTKKAANE